MIIHPAIELEGGEDAGAIRDLMSQTSVTVGFSRSYRSIMQTSPKGLRLSGSLQITALLYLPTLPPR